MAIGASLGHVTQREVSIMVLVGIITFTAYGGVANYLSGVSRQIDSYGNNTPSRRDFKMKNIDDKIQREALLPLVAEIQNLAWSNSLCC